MKQAGLIIFVIGLLITIFTGFKYVTRVKVADIGHIQISRSKTHNLTWSPLAGIAVMAVGGVVFLLSRKK
jgi:LPXTG-motif cell wall-anchored protein